MDEPRVGRELDTAVAEKIFKMHDFAESIYGELIALPEGRTRPPSGKTTQHQLIPHYSTNIADAWQVVERLHERRIYTRLYGGVTMEGAPVWLCYYGLLQSWNEVSAETAPEAICRAALMVVDNERREA